MTIHVVIATSSPFELVAKCYVPKCDRMATGRTTTYNPMCKECYILKQRATHYSELVYKYMRVRKGVDYANYMASRKIQSWAPYGETGDWSDHPEWTQSVQDELDKANARARKSILEYLTNIKESS